MKVPQHFCPGPNPQPLPQGGQHTRRLGRRMSRAVVSWRFEPGGCTRNQLQDAAVQRSPSRARQGCVQPKVEVKTTTQAAASHRVWCVRFCLCQPTPCNPRKSENFQVTRMTVKRVTKARIPKLPRPGQVCALFLTGLPEPRPLITGVHQGVDWLIRFLQPDTADIAWNRIEANMMKQATQPVQKEASPAATAPVSTAVPERRRPGRSVQVNPYLIPLLRDAGNKEIIPVGFTTTDASDPAGNLAPIVGVVVSVGLSLLLWAILIRVGFWVLR